MASPSTSSVANPPRPEWFDAILGTYTPGLERYDSRLLILEREYNDQRRPLLERQRKQEQAQQLIRRLIPQVEKRWKIEKSTLWLKIKKIGLDQKRFGELVSRCWTDGLAKILNEQHAKCKTGSVDAFYRKWARTFAVSARNLASQIRRARQAAHPSSVDKRLWLLLQSALQLPDDGDLWLPRPRFPSLINDLDGLANAVERCLSSETQATVLKQLHHDAFEGRIFKDRPDLNEQELRTLVTDTEGTVHYGAWSELLKVLHPELRRVKGLNKQLKAKARKQRKAS
jgi:hypothetical protein